MFYSQEEYNAQIAELLAQGLTLDQAGAQVEENMAEDERDYNEFRNRQNMIDDEWYADQYDI
jgi:hypothetical protein